MAEDAQRAEGTSRQVSLLTRVPELDVALGYGWRSPNDTTKRTVRCASCCPKRCPTAHFDAFCLHGWANKNPAFAGLS
jgi:hypothetical protein